MYPTITILFQEASNEGALKKEVDPKIAALSVTSLINGIYRGYFVIPDKLQSEKTSKTIIENYLNQIKNI